MFLTPVNTGREYGRRSTLPVFMAVLRVMFLTPANTGREHGHLSTLPVFMACVTGHIFDTRERRS